MQATSFEEALKATLTGVNEAFEKADADLHLEVAHASQALAKITQSAATLKLTKTQEFESGINYVLDIAGKGKNYTLTQFFVPARGYPVKILSSAYSGSVREDGTEIPPNQGREIAVCNDKAALADYFSKLASNPDSLLVTAAAYIMRAK